MIVMDLYADNLYCFNDFHVNFSYPKKIVNSYIEDECLDERKNFRYRKVNIIMGTNASGKTSLGHLIMSIFNFVTNKNLGAISRYISDKSRRAVFGTDFVVKIDSEYYMYRVHAVFTPPSDGEYTSENVSINVRSINVRKNDSYEVCVERIEKSNHGLTNGNYITELEKIKGLTWFFVFPEDYKGWKIAKGKETLYLKIMETVLKVLDPAVNAVERLEGVDNSFVIRMAGKEVIVQDGEIAKSNVLSTGTKAGLDIAAIVTSILAGDHGFYYCDEKFSYINSDIERAILALMIDKIRPDTQIFFTTHNTDVLDMPLPKHSYNILRKTIEGEKQVISVANVGDYLKKSTDSVRNAVENDLFLSSPSLELLDNLEDLREL